MVNIRYLGISQVYQFLKFFFRIFKKFAFTSLLNTTLPNLAIKKNFKNVKLWMVASSKN